MKVTTAVPVTLNIYGNGFIQMDQDATYVVMQLLDVLLVYKMIKR